MNPKKHSSLSFYLRVLKNAFSKFFNEDILTQSAALAYYMVFALPPMLVIIFWLAGLWFEEVLVREAVFDEFGALMGQDGAKQLMATLERITSSKPTLWAAIIGVGSLLLMASTVFVTMKQALNMIFEVTVKRSLSREIWKMLFDRFLSIAMLSVIAFILTLSMVVSALITAFSEIMEKWMGDYTSWLLLVGLVVLNLVVLTLLFAISYRYMPDIRLKWSNTWFGALFTAGLFAIGKSLIAFFIGNSQVSNFYDAAGSILVLMLWVYYSSAIFYFGAIITKCRANLLNENKKSIKKSRPSVLTGPRIPIL